jgi:glycosyltransferase involved in cell wall biosynthesis
MTDEQIVSEVEQEIPKPPRTVIICSRRIITDYSLYLKFLLVGLADESAQVLLIVPPRIDIESVVPPAFEVVRYPAVDFLLAGRYNRRVLLEQLTSFRPALLHCLCESMAPLTRRLSRQLEIRYILNIDTLLDARSSFLDARCAGLAAPAKSIADHLIAAYPKYADRVKQINIGAFVADKAACFTHRDLSTPIKSGFGTGCVPGIVIAQPRGYISTPIKPGLRAGIDNVLHVLHRLVIENYRFMAAIITQPRTNCLFSMSRTAFVGRITAYRQMVRSERHIRTLLGKLDLSRVVTLIPPLITIDPAIAAADIFIVPCPSSCFNMALLSAMSAGACVAACKGGVDDLIIDGSTAVVFNPNDQLSIYIALKRLLDAPDYTRQIAAQAQEYLRRNHHVSAMVASTLQLYREASARK